MRDLIYRRVIGFASGALVAGCVSYQGTPVTSAMMSEDFLKSFALTQCGYSWEDHQKQSEAAHKRCSRRWANAFAAKLERTYPAVDLKQLIQRCDAYPQSCEPRILEQWAQDAEDAQALRNEKRATASSTDSNSEERAKKISTPMGKECEDHSHSP